MQTVQQEDLLTVLRQVLDPELGMNIVDLGMVEKLEFEGDGVHAVLLMTSPACPLGETIVENAEQALLGLPGVKKARVELALEPSWNPSRMSDWARRQLGWA